MKQSSADKMMEYINSKYDDHFTYKARSGVGTGIPEILVNSEKYPEADIWVQVLNKEGKDIFTDNYVYYKYEAQTRALIAETIKNALDSEVRTNYSIETKCPRNTFGEQTTLEEFASSEDVHLTFIATVAPGYVIQDEDALAQIITDIFQGKINITRGMVFFARDEGEYDRGPALTLSEEGGMRYFDFRMNDVHTLRFAEWR
jgi:hypothetical protein